MKHNPFHYKIVLQKLTYEEAFKIRQYLYEIGFSEEDFEYDTKDY